MYERLGTPWEVAKWKSLYERVVELVEGDDLIRQLVKLKATKQMQINLEFGIIGGMTDE